MQRNGSTDDAAAAARAAAVAELTSVVAPVLEMIRAARDALSRLRHARSLELYERALAAAEALPLPHDSLILAFCVSLVVDSRTIWREDATAASGTSQVGEVLIAAWRNDERALLLAQRCIALFHTRWLAGTLFTLSPQEVVFFARFECPLQVCAEQFIWFMDSALCYWPPLPTTAELEARLRGVHGALRTVLELDARPDLQLSAIAATNLTSIMCRIREDEAAGGSMLSGLQSTYGLSDAESMALVTLTTRECLTWNDGSRELLTRWRERAATDVARHGLRRCALPSCNSEEPEPKLFKLCGRCRGAAYCSAAHCKEDWKRHKRELGCQAAADGS
jgi:hypothetical protein